MTEETKPESTEPEKKDAPAKSTGTSLKEHVFRQDTLYCILSGWLVYNAIMYVLPIGEVASHQAYHRACNAAFIKNFSKALRKHGFSLHGIWKNCKGLYNKEYQAAMNVQAVVNEKCLHNAFLYFMFNSSLPIPFALLPVLLTGMYTLCNYLSGLFKCLGINFLEPIFQKVLVHAKLNPAYPQDGSKGPYRQNIPYWGAWCEMAVCVALFVQLFTPARSFLLLIVYVQFMLIRHTADRHARIVSGELRQKLDKLFHHARCPGFIGTVYDKIRDGIITVANKTSNQHQR